MDRFTGKMKTPNHAIERTADPRHASCVRTCRAGVPIRSAMTLAWKTKNEYDQGDIATSSGLGVLPVVRDPESLAINESE